MGGVIESIFLPSSLTGPKPKGPTDEQLKLQKQQETAINQQKSEEESRRSSRSKIISAAQGRGRGLGTLFRRTGEAGVQTLGGA